MSLGEKQSACWRAVVGRCCRSPASWATTAITAFAHRIVQTVQMGYALIVRGANLAVENELPPGIGQPLEWHTEQVGAS
jgi:hypothetical protein